MSNPVIEAIQSRRSCRAFKVLLKSLGIEGDWEGIGHCALGYAAAPLPAGAPRKPGRIVWA